MTPNPTQCRFAAVLILIHLAFFATGLVLRPKVDSDASSGMLVWRAMERGARWNNAFEPDPKNIAEDRQEYLTWWSPGQYLAVGPLHGLGASWGVAIVTATLVCSLCGLFGYWWLYLSLGFSQACSAWSALILSVAWHVTRNYGEFSGGELPLFAVAPWLVGLIVRLRPISYWSIIPFAVIYWVGAMTKLSFCVTAAAVLAGVCCVELFPAPSLRRLAALAAVAAAMMLAAHLLLWITFLRHGANPGSMETHGQPWWYVLPAVLVLPPGSVLGLGSLLERIFLFPGHAILAGQASLAPILWAFVPAIAVAFWALARHSLLSNSYKSLMLGVAGTYAVILGALIIAGAPISMEDRQFFPVGALLLPSYVELARLGASWAWKWAARMALTLACLYGLIALVVHARQLSRTANVGRAGFTQHIISPQAMSVLHSLDDQDGKTATGTLIYVPSPEISFELSRTRVLSTFDLALSPAELRLRNRLGRVPLLVILSNPVLEFGGRDEIVRRSFSDYSPSEWKRRIVGEWTFYYQGAWPLNDAPRQ
jgi:hypothetical protein